MALSYDVLDFFHSHHVFFLSFFLSFFISLFQGGGGGGVCLTAKRMASVSLSSAMLLFYKKRPDSIVYMYMVYRATK